MKKAIDRVMEKHKETLLEDQIKELKRELMMAQVRIKELEKR